MISDNNRWSKCWKTVPLPKTGPFSTDFGPKWRLSLVYSISVIVHIVILCMSVAHFLISIVSWFPETCIIIGILFCHWRDASLLTSEKEDILILGGRVRGHTSPNAQNHTFFQREVFSKDLRSQIFQIFAQSFAEIHKNFQRKIRLICPWNSE